jgi:hypothetical protein
MTESWSMCEHFCLRCRCSNFLMFLLIPVHGSDVSPRTVYGLTPSDNIVGEPPWAVRKFVARWSIIISSPDEWAMAIAVTKCKTSPIISLVSHDDSIALRLEMRWRQRWTDTNISCCISLCFSQGYLLWSSPSGTWKHGDVIKLYKANSPWMKRSTTSEQLQEYACIYGTILLRAILYLFWRPLLGMATVYSSYGEETPQSTYSKDWGHIVVWNGQGAT